MAGRLETGEHDPGGWGGWGMQLPLRGLIISEPPGGAWETPSSGHWSCGGSRQCPSAFLRPVFSAGNLPLAACGGPRARPRLLQKSSFSFPRNTEVGKGSGQVGLGTKNKLTHLFFLRLAVRPEPLPSLGHRKQQWEQLSQLPLSWGLGAVPGSPHVPSPSQAALPQARTPAKGMPVCAFA